MLVLSFLARASAQGVDVRMDLFIETPQQAARRSERWERFETYRSVDSGSGGGPVRVPEAHGEGEVPPRSAARSRRAAASSGAGGAPCVRSGAAADGDAPRGCSGSAPMMGGPYASPDGAPAMSDGERVAHPAAMASEQGPGSRALDLDEPEPYSIAGEAYRRELAYDRGRVRRRKAIQAVRVLAYIVLAPVAVVAVFIAAYALTYVLNGATPDELLAALRSLALRAEGLVAEWTSMLPAR